MVDLGDQRFVEFAFVHCPAMLKPDESFEDSVGQVVQRLADLLPDRTIAFCLAGADVAGGVRGLGRSLPPAHAWLVQRRTELAAIQADLAAHEPCGVGLSGCADTPLGRIDFFALAISVDMRCRGMLAVLRDANGAAISPAEVQFLGALSAQLSHAATGAELHRELRDLHYGVVRCLVNAVEETDPATCGHSERVVDLCRGMAAQLGLSAAETERLAWAAILHDVGKISVDSRVLNKPARLSAQEYALVREHAAAGERLLRPVAKLRDIGRAIRHHHERYDGGGYPDGLAGAEIPLPSRIIAVGDVFDALVSQRPYREADSRASAMRYMRDGAGSQFDPRIVAALLAFLEPHEGDAPRATGVEEIPVPQPV